MSAYHHMGMVSPFKITRDVAAAKSSGATKFGDEWLTWRGIAYLHCHHHWPKIDSLEVCYSDATQSNLNPSPAWSACLASSYVQDLMHNTV